MPSQGNRKNITKNRQITAASFSI